MPKESCTRISKKIGMKQLLDKVQKRDGSIVDFDSKRIANAIYKAMQETEESGHKGALSICKQVIEELNNISAVDKTFIPAVEDIQDRVEKTLILNQYVKTAKAYILYREKQAEERRQRGFISEHVERLAAESKKYFRNTLSELVYLRSYARWIEKEQRRETWIETIDRYVVFMHKNLGDRLSSKEYEEIRRTVLNQEVMPSMRLLQFAGTAADSTNVCAYNCAYIAPSTLEDFGEVMHVSMCGTGVGFSVESVNIQALPIIKRQTGKKLKTHVVKDSREGWCDALVLGLKTWFNGKDIDFDYSKLRPAGTRLKTMGGKSSGPEPLRSMLDFSKEKVLHRQGRRFTNLDAYDILCKIGEIVVAGGVRRSAMISLSDLDDAELCNAKKGLFYYTDPQRSMTNNSTVYVDKPTNKEFLEEWVALIKSGSGERGIFNRSSLAKTLPQRRLQFLEKEGYIHNNKITGIIGTNPCGEIILRSKSFCNLTEIVARVEDTEESLLRKIKVATILGTYQATLTKFPYLSEEWEKNCQQERLLGVSITGQWDSKVVRNPKILAKLKDRAILVNRIYAEKFGINQATAITCVKPSGTVSQVVDCASGMHSRFAPYYIRRIRISATDALFKMLRDQGVPAYPEVGQTEENASTFVLEFPIKAPRGAICRNDMNAMEQLRYWKIVKTNYTEHNPSVTISVDEDEWIRIANWIYDNWDIVGGLSFLPKANHVYRLAPYEEVTKERYESLVKELKDIDFSQIVIYERTDETEVKRELACSGNACELD